MDFVQQNNGRISIRSFLVCSWYTMRLWSAVCCDTFIKNADNEKRVFYSCADSFFFLLSPYYSFRNTIHRPKKLPHNYTCIHLTDTLQIQFIRHTQHTRDSVAIFALLVTNEEKRWKTSELVTVCGHILFHFEHYEMISDFAEFRWMKMDN